MSFLLEVLAVLYFFVPAYVANMVPVHVRGLKFFAWPLDFGSTLRGKRLFGANKTWRGFLFGVAAALVVFFVQQLLFINGFFHWASLIDYSRVHVLLGAAIGVGALIGDALESAAKRQLSIAPGKQLFFWDQLDFMFGALFVTIPFWFSSWLAVIVALLVVFVLTVGVQRCAFWLGLKDDPL